MNDFDDLLESLNTLELKPLEDRLRSDNDQNKILFERLKFLIHHLMCDSFDLRDLFGKLRSRKFHNQFDTKELPEEIALLYFRILRHIIYCKPLFMDVLEHSPEELEFYVSKF